MKTVVIELQFGDDVEIDDEVVNKELTTRIKYEALYWVDSPVGSDGWRLEAENERLTQQLVVTTVNSNRKLQGEVERLRGLLKRVLDSASPQKRWDVLMLEIEKEVGDE